MTLNKSTFAKIHKVSRAAITLAVKSGALVEDAGGFIDDSQESNAAWIARRRGGKAPASSKEKPTEKKTKAKPEAAKKERPAKVAAPEIEQDADIDEIEDEQEGAGDYEEMGLLSIQKLRAEIRFKGEQADTALQKRLERLDQLVDRELVSRAFAKIGQELKTRFIEMPQRAAAAISALARSGSSEIEIQKYLEDEISRALQAVKAALQEF